MNQEIHIVDREDQVLWYLDPGGHRYVIQIRDNHREIRQWLEAMTQGTVVISGQGVLPRPGSCDDAANIYYSINRNQWAVYFAESRDAMAFKLAWGGSQ